MLFHENVWLTFVNLLLPSIMCLTCKEIMELSQKTKLHMYDLQTIQPNETVKCISRLGSRKISLPEAEYIWNNVIKFHKGIENIPDDVLKELKWVSIAVPPEDISNLTLSDIEVISNFGRYYGLATVQLEAIADRVREDFGQKQPEDYTGNDLIVLRQILCAFNASEIDRIHPKAYKEAAFEIGKLKDCKYDVLQAFSRLAVQKNAFGPVDRWTTEVLEILGGVADLIKDIKF